MRRARRRSAEIEPAPPLDLDKRRRDIEAFDKLGPLTKAVIADAPKDLWVRDMLDAYRRRPRQMIDPDAEPGSAVGPPDSPDAQMAAFIAQEIRARFPRWVGPLTPPKRGRRYG